jgi:hypothetical protein
LEKGSPLRFNKLEFPVPKDDLFQVWLKLAQWFLRRILMTPSHFYDYLPFEEDMVLYFNKTFIPFTKG